MTKKPKIVNEEDLIITKKIDKDIYGGWQQVTDIVYEKNGKVRFTGSGVSYYNNGQLMWKGNFTDGKMDGAWFRYHNNGRLESKGTYKDGMSDGLWVKYHQNGRLSWKGTYKNRKKEGPWVNYNEDGTVREKPTGTYKDGVKVR